MPWWVFALVLFSTFIIFAFVHFLSKNKRPFSRALLSMCSGIAVLTAINLSSALTGVYIPVSLLSLLTSLAGGVPGVTLLLFLNLFL